MHPTHAEQIEILRDLIHHRKWSTKAVKDSHQKGSLEFAVLSGEGHGDHARGIAFCNALKRKYGECHITLFTRHCGSMVEHDMAHSAMLMGAIDAHIPLHFFGRRLLIGWLVKQFHAVFDCVPYPIGTYWSLPSYDAPHAEPAPLELHLQAQADICLKPWLDIYTAHPTENWKLLKASYNIWQIMTASSGIDVDERDLIPPVELAPFPTELRLAGVDPSLAVETMKLGQGETDWKLAEATGRYVTVHNSAGGSAGMKTAPPAVFDAIVSRLAADGVKAIQIGYGGEQKIKGADDRRGLRLPLSARLMAGAIAHVDIEGFLQHIARAMDTRTFMLVGPTPYYLFRNDTTEAYVELIEREQGPSTPCPFGCCFQSSTDWSKRCALGQDNNPNWPYCMNMPSSAKAAEAAAQFVRETEEKKWPTLQAMEAAEKA